MHHDDTSFSLLLFRYLWPFWLFKDASRGDLYARAAAYQYNREKRGYLPGYLAKWMFICMFALALTSGFETLAAKAGGMTEVFTYLAAGCGVAFALGVCVLMNTGYVYVYLSGHDR